MELGKTGQTVGKGIGGNKMTYYCTKCNRKHVRGKIHEAHVAYAAKEEPEKKPVATDWAPLLKSGKMWRYNEEGEYVERYMTKKEELILARQIANARGEKWTRIKEWKRKRALRRLEKES